MCGRRRKGTYAGFWVNMFICMTPPFWRFILDKDTDTVEPIELRHLRFRIIMFQIKTTLYKYRDRPP
jgi:hypothetical protein